MLGSHVAGKAIEVLLAVGETGKTLRQRNAAQIFGVPVGPGQGPGGGRQESLVLCRCKHAYLSWSSNRKPRCMHGDVQVN
jgi:hypothetical protein